MVYVGVDLHRKRSHVVALGDQGEKLLSRRIANEPEEFFRIFGELEPEPLTVAFEATYGWGWFADMLADAGIPAHMAHPLATKAISSARVKNDAVDAKTLAHLLRANLLPEAWMAPLEVREARRLVRMRVSTLRIASRCKCQIHSILADHRVIPPMADLFSPGGRRLLAGVRLPQISARRVEANLRIIDTALTEVAAADHEIRALFRGDDRVRRLTAIPGIGFTSATTIAAEISDITRFPTPGISAPGRVSRHQSTPPTSTPGEVTSPSRARGGSGGSSSRPPPAPACAILICAGSTIASPAGAARRSPAWPLRTGC
jgi:transposase